MVMIVRPDGRWANEFASIAADLRDRVGGISTRIDHIGSTSVPDLPAKDVIYVQITVADDDRLVQVASALDGLGWRRNSDVVRDHPLLG